MNKKGFTLIELLIAAAIFAFAMSGILQMFISCAFLDEANRNKSIATSHAEFLMEDIMGYMRNNEISSLQTQIVNGAWNRDSSTTTPTIGIYLGNTSSCILNSESITTTCEDDSNPLKITITVSWKDREQVNERNLVLKTSVLRR